MPGDAAETLASGVPGNAGVEAASLVAARLAGIELAAVGKAAPSAYVHEAIAACRDSGRTPVILSRQSRQAVQAWLARFALDDQVRYVIAPDDRAPARERLDDGLLAGGLRGLDIRPDSCALITATPSAVERARGGGLQSIGYASAPALGQRLADSGAEAVMPSLADLTLRLRARPLAR